MKYFVPSHLLDYFGSEALKSLENGHHVETLALGLGVLENDSIQVEEIIFPSQYATETQVEDKGKMYIHQIKI